MSFTSMYKIIEKKKNGEQLAQDELEFFIHNLVQGKVPEYQTSALLMAIYFQGMTIKETSILTQLMLDSGEKLVFEGSDFVDKHSTGGVGDKTSFILGPIAAACGVKVPMMAGRALGHTGGTIDKLEAINGFKTNIDLQDFKKIIQQSGLAIIAQSDKIATADGLIYSLRDVTATIDSIPLITASIMSKKLAEGANGLVFDIKVGNGSFTPAQSTATKLANSILRTAKQFDKQAVTLLTNMDQPLGRSVGHSIELIECVEILKGEKLKEDLALLSIEFAAYMIFIAKKAKSLSLARKMAIKVIKNGEALNKFKEMITIQEGDTAFIDNYNELNIASEKTVITANKNGWIKNFHNKNIGHYLIRLGGGRKTRNQHIDHAVGFYFDKKIGDKIKIGDVLATIYHHPEQKEEAAMIKQDFLNKSLKISKTKITKPKLIYKIKSNFKS